MQEGTKNRIAEAMEFTTIMNRGEVLPTLEDILQELSFDFSKPLLQKYLGFIEQHFKDMGSREEEEFQEWRTKK